MAKVVSLSDKKRQKELALEAQLSEVRQQLDELEQKQQVLLAQRNTLESQLYTPREQAALNIQREAAKLSW